MSNTDEMKKGKRLFIYHPKVGYVRAWVVEPTQSGLAEMTVSINSESLPGVAQMVINVNQWEVYLADDPVILNRIADTYVKPWLTR